MQGNSGEREEKGRLAFEGLSRQAYRCGSIRLKRVLSALDDRGIGLVLSTNSKFCRHFREDWQESVGGNYRGGFVLAMFGMIL